VGASAEQLAHKCAWRTVPALIRVFVPILAVLAVRLDMVVPADQQARADQQAQADQLEALAPMPGRAPPVPLGLHPQMDSSGSMVAQVSRSIGQIVP